MERIYRKTILSTFIDVTNSALASGAGMARDSLTPLLSRSSRWPLFPPVACLPTSRIKGSQKNIKINNNNFPKEFSCFKKKKLFSRINHLRQIIVDGI